VKEVCVKISARNQFSGTVKQIVRGPVSAEVTVSIAPNIDVVAVISATSVDNLGLATGKPARVLIKASSVLIGVD
jgi:molybdopterin-binding protein